LKYVKFDDSGTRQVLQLSNLTTVVLDGTQVSDTGLQEILKQPKLKSLTVHGTKVTKEGLQKAKKAHPQIKFDVPLFYLPSSGTFNLLFNRHSPSPQTASANPSVERQVRRREESWSIRFNKRPTVFERNLAPSFRSADKNHLALHGLTIAVDAYLATFCERRPIY